MPPLTFYTLPTTCSNCTADNRQFLCQMQVLYLQSHMQQHRTVEAHGAFSLLGFRVKKDFTVKLVSAVL